MRAAIINQSEIAACEEKTTSEKANFCSNTVFSLYFKFRAKKFHAAKALTFSLYFLFRRDQNHHSNLTSKIMKMCVQILKKTPPQYNSNSLNFKNQETTNNSPSYRCAAINKPDLEMNRIWFGIALTETRLKLYSDLKKESA